MKKILCSFMLVAAFLLSVFMPRMAFADSIKSIENKGAYLQLGNYTGATLTSKIQISKSQIKVKKAGNVVYVYDNSFSDKYSSVNEPIYYKLYYGQIITPVTISADSLLTIITGYLNAGNTITATVSGVSTEASLLNVVTYTENSSNNSDIIADKVAVIADQTGKGNNIYGSTAAITGTLDTDVIAAQGGTYYIYVTNLLVTNSHATVGTVVELIDDFDNQVIYRGYAAPAGGGFVASFPTPLKVKTLNSKLQVRCITTGSNVYVSAVGFKAT